MTVAILNFRDQWVQDFLWSHIVPTDMRPDYTKMDAMRHVEEQIYNRNEFLIGNEQVIMRCVVHNEWVVEPHIMGNGHYMRSVMEEALEYGVQHTNFQRAVVWTHYKSIGRILERCGFELTGTVPRYHYTPDGLADMMSYVREMR